MDMSYMFYNCKSLTKLEFNALDTPHLLLFNHVFENCENLETVKLPLLNIVMVNSFESLFANCRKLKTYELAPKSEATIPSILTNMFLNCESLKAIDLRNFRMTLLYSLTSAFEGCTNLEEIKFEDYMKSEFILTMDRAFKNCKSLPYINLTALHAKTVENLSEAFSGCESLEALDMPYVNTSKVNDMSFIFKNNKNIVNLELNSFNTLNIKEEEKMRGMFENFSKKENVTMVIGDKKKIENILHKIPDNVVVVKPE